jgi:hypothetical protein
MITTVGKYNRGLKIDRSMFEGTIMEMYPAQRTITAV